jgi:hypothetical protein
MHSKNFKKLIFIFFVIISLFIFHVNFVSGAGINSSPTVTPSVTPSQINIIDDEGNVEITDEALKLDIKMVNQEFISRKITVELTINPSIDSGKAAIDWVFNSDLFSIVGQTRDVVTLNKDKELKVLKEFIPNTKYQRSANFDLKISVRVTATAYDINYLSTSILPFTMNPKYEVTPLINSYSTVKTLSYYAAIILIIVSSSALIVLFAYLLNKFLIYLNTDEEK